MGNGYDSLDNEIDRLRKRVKKLEAQLAESQREIERCHAVMKVTCPSIEELKAQLAEAKSKSVESVVVSLRGIIEHQTSQLEELLKENNELNEHVAATRKENESLRKQLRLVIIDQANVEAELNDSRLRWQTGPVPEDGRRAHEGKESPLDPALALRR